MHSDEKFWDPKLLGNTDHTKTSNTFDLTLIKFEEIFSLCLNLWSFFSAWKHCTNKEINHL